MQTRQLSTAAGVLATIAFSGLAKAQEPPKIPVHGCVRSVGATHVLREVKSLMPEGERNPAQPQDAGWMPEAIWDLAVRGHQYAMVDRQAARVTVTDSGFRNRRDIGRKGSGPGELRTPISVAFAPRGDTLWVLDEGRHMLVAFTTTGRYIRELRVPSAAREVTVAQNGSIYVSHQFMARGVRGSVPLVTAIGNGRDDTTTVLAATQPEVIPPRFVLPGPMTVRVKALGSYLAVYYQPAGVVELYETVGTQMKRMSTISACMPPETAEALNRQRASGQNSQSWVALVGDVTLHGDTVYVVTDRVDKSGRHAIQRFLARTGADVGAIVMDATPAKFVGEVRFGISPTDLVSFSVSEGSVVRFDAARRVTR